jgi:conjugal transfer pilus assembly protein TraK
MLMLCSLPISCDLFATQLIEGSERTHVQVNVSARELNRLAIAGRRIGIVVPSQKGAISYVKDESAGALYFSFPKDNPNPGTVTLFVTEEQAPTVTYKLILIPSPIAGEEIMIKPVAHNETAAVRKSVNGRAASYQRQIKELILSMTDDAGATAQAIEVNQIIPLWKEGKLVLLSKTVQGEMVGEKYRLTNAAHSTIQLMEQELFRRGVIAISVEHQTLPPDGQSLIYVVRGRMENE